MKYLFIIALLYGFQAQADLFSTEQCKIKKPFLFGEQYLNIDHVDPISIRGTRQGGRKGKAVFYNASVGNVFLEVQFTYSNESLSTLTCGGRRQLNSLRQILNKEQEIRTSHRNMIATLNNRYWDEYSSIAQSVAEINKATNSQPISLMLSITRNSCEIRAYTVKKSDQKERRTSFEYSSEGIRNYETKLPLDDCIVYEADVEQILNKLSYMIYNGIEDKDNDMPIVPRNAPPLDKHL